MANISLPSPNIPIGTAKIGGEREVAVRISSPWFQRMTEWIKKTNEDSLSTNGKLTVTATSNTNIRLSYIGSDGVTRTADITLTP